MQGVRIEKVLAEEIELLQKFSWQTFNDSSSEFNTEENMLKTFNKDFSLEQITTEFYDRNSQFYFAKEKGNVIGYLKLNFGEAQTELKEASGMEIERIYVLKNYHGKAIGKILCEKAFSIAVELKLEYLWLGVWEKNERAINFYKKNGFVEFATHSFMLGDDNQTDIMMKLHLNN